MSPRDNDPQDDPRDRLRRPASGGDGQTHAGRASGRSSGASGRSSGASGRSSGGSGRAGGQGPGEPRPYNTYNSRPRGLFARLRDEDDLEIERREEERAQRRATSHGAAGAGAARAGAAGAADGRGLGGGRGQRGGGGGGVPPTGPLAFMRRPLFGRPRLTPLRLIKYFVLAVIGWVVLSIVLFFISAQKHAGDLPKGAQAALTSSGPMLFTPSNVLVLGLDNRPRHGYSAKEAGSNYSERDANTDTIMLWRVGGGVSRRLSIPRDTLVNLPGLGEAKINAAWPYGGPAYAIHAIERFTGIKINHLIIVDLGNFAKFINDIGGVTIRTPRICSEISGGASNGGYTLNLKPGVHHLSGTEALTLARTRENRCDPAYNDLNREAMQQQIMNAIKSQLFSVHAFLHLPWAAWDAPGTIQTDMGGLTLMQLFASAELGGSSKPMLLKETPSVYNGADVLVPSAANVRRQVQRLINGN